jgi:plastocyanin
VKRLFVCFVSSVVITLLGGAPALARTHQATIGNYYYEDDQQKDRTKLVVRQGDQITFTVRDPAYPPHTVDVDELKIHSPDLLVGETYTTPPLSRAGNFYLYCRPHEARGHHTRLIVLAAATKTSAPARTAAPASSPAPGVGQRTSAPATAQAAPTPTSTLTPIGVAKASPGVLERPIRQNPNSIEALTGHRVSNEAPWTSSLWWLLIATVPIVGAAAVALRRARVAQYQPRVENMRRIRQAPVKRVPARKQAPRKKPSPRKRTR